MSYDYMNMDDDMRNLSLLAPLRRGTHDEPDAPVKKWPAGYWEKYEELRREARALCGYQHANVVVLMNGYYEVRFLALDGSMFHGPQHSDRLDALAAFNAMWADYARIPSTRD